MDPQRLQRDWYGNGMEVIFGRVATRALHVSDVWRKVAPYLRENCSPGNVVLYCNAAESGEAQ
jgi:hypothetical protein